MASALVGIGTPASAQMYSPQESPWVMLRDYINKDKKEGAQPAKAAPKATNATVSVKPASASKQVPAVSESDHESVDTSEDEESDEVVLGTPVDAQGRRGIWSLVLESEGTTAWMNDRDVVPQNGSVMVSVLFDHEPAMTMANGVVFRSAKARVRVDCSAQPATVVGITLFSKKSGDGRVVGEHMRPLELRTVPSGVAIEARVREMTKSSCR